jgi:hypothetical protein
MRFRGEYNPDFVYMANDIVLLDGCSWAATKVISLRTPPPGDGWILCAAKGRDGSAGRDGRDGAEGKTGPGIPTGGTSNQVLIKQSDDDLDARWGSVTATQIGAAKEQHRHSMDDVIGLSFALGATAPVHHIHAVSDIGGLKELLDSKCNARHRHDAEDISIGDMTMRSLVLSNAEPTITLRSNESGEMSTIKQTMGGNMEIVSSGGLSITIGDIALLRAGRNTVSIDGTMVANSVKAGFAGLIISGPVTPKTGNGEKGQLCWDSEYLYLCIGKGIWKKIRLEELA